MLLAACLLFAPMNISADHLKPVARVLRIENDFGVEELENPAWTAAEKIKVGNYWSGERAPAGRGFEARVLWSGSFLYVRFDAKQKEPLVVSGKPDTGNEADRLWERDVCEIFLAPDKRQFRKYFEFEVAPTGEWMDLKIHQKTDDRTTDWNYSSGLKTAARIESDRVVMAIKIPWDAFGTKPSAGDIWAGNIYRAVGSGEGRGYLAWSPTLTKTPNFHRPEKFGEFEFTGSKDGSL